MIFITNFLLKGAPVGRLRNLDQKEAIRRIRPASKRSAQCHHLPSGFQAWL